MHILLADQNPKALYALKTLFQEKPKFDVCGDAADAETLLVLAEENRPDLILMDWELQGMSATNLIDELHKIENKPVIVVMSTNPDEGRIIIGAGADAFISKSDPPDWMMETLYKYEEQTLDTSE